MNSIFVSVVTMDHINIERDVKFVDNLGVDGLHIDVMDGSFVPRYGIYPEIVEKISDISDLALDLDLLVSDPMFAINEFKNKGKIYSVRFHVESCLGNEMRVIDKIHEIGAKAVPSFNLATGFDSLKRLARNDEIDGVMLMGIHPGVLKQNHRPENIKRDMSDLLEVLEDTKAVNFIGLDGGVSFETIPYLKDAGINNFVCGSSSIYKGIDYKQNWEENAKKISSNYHKIRNLLK